MSSDEPKKVEFPKKLLDKIDDDLIKEIENYDENELKEKIVKTEALIVDTDAEIENSDKIKVLKEDLKAIMSAHRDTKNGANAIIKFCVHNLRKRGLSLK